MDAGGVRNVEFVPFRAVSNCSFCLEKFNLIKRKHHCHHCGQVFCGACSLQRVQIPKYGHKQSVRICNACFLYVCVELDDKASLLSMPLYELKRHAEKYNINLTGCLEKKDIVERIFDAQGPARSRSSSYALPRESIPSSSFDVDGKEEINKNEAKIEDMSIADLKLILSNHGIDFSNCLEKQELVDKVRNRCPSVRSTAELFTVPEQDLCIICYERRINTVLLECGHLALCRECTKCITECPICRRKISRIVHTYHANK